MVENEHAFVSKLMRNHPVVGMGFTPVSASKGKQVYSKWEGWVSLQLKPYTLSHIPGSDGNPIQLDFVGTTTMVDNIATSFGWRPKNALRWVSELSECGLISDELASVLLGSIATRQSDRRSALPSARRSEVLAKTSGKCVYCGVVLTTRMGHPNSYHADHVLAHSSGGSDRVANLVPSCRTCNLRKKDKTLAELLGWDKGSAA